MLTVTDYPDECISLEVNSISTSHLQKASLQEEDDLATIELCPIDLLWFWDKGFFLKATFGLIVVQLYQSFILAIGTLCAEPLPSQHLGHLIRQIERETSGCCVWLPPSCFF